MEKKAGLWIDHRNAGIVIGKEAWEEIKEILSNMEKHVCSMGVIASENSSTEGVWDNK